MTRPHIIRADTLDLQDHEAPSAKDHSHHLTHPLPFGEGPLAPHQAITLQHVEQQAAELHTRSPRVSQDLSNKELQLLHDEHSSYDGSETEFGTNTRGSEDTLADQRNGSMVGGEGEELADGETDDNLEDDMMDKISSSPSIDDGGYTLPLRWPMRTVSLPETPSGPNTPQASVPIHEASSSPFVSTPEHLPLLFTQKQEGPGPSEDHHQKGEYDLDRLSASSDHKGHEGRTHDRLSPLDNEDGINHLCEGLEYLKEPYDADLDPLDLHDLLLPPDDPLLDNSFDDAQLPDVPSGSSSSDSSSTDSDGPDGYDDDAGDVSFSNDSRFIDSGWGGECLREIEDIDFEFVYALHTFIATVEGQANATKGDTMVLLDDTNSYWWLVRVVKDSSIGYLPAEHIETPTERLARLNKHRNIDLSQTMLGDNPEKSKNPLKKAMRRRNAKTVQFSAPTYVEASDVDYSTEEEGEGEDLGNEEAADAEAHNAQQKQDDTAIVEPLKLRASAKEALANPEPRSEVSLENGAGETHDITAVENPRTSEEMLDHLSMAYQGLGGPASLTITDDGLAAKSRNGFVRNTDSFFKDESVETRKITITPNLLRDDSSNSTIRSNESKELKPRGSLDTLEKAVSPPEKGKEDKKRKEKKSGMLSGLFKRKDKKSRSQDDDVEVAERLSEELSSPQPKESIESVSQDTRFSTPIGRSASQRQTSKLQKPNPTKGSHSAKAPLSQDISPAQRLETARPEIAEPQFSQQQSADVAAPDRAAPNDMSPPDRIAPDAADAVASMHVVNTDTERESELAPSQLRVKSMEQSNEQEQTTESTKDVRRNEGLFAPVRDVLRSSPTTSDPKPEKVKKAKQRVVMDDFDSSPDGDEPPKPIFESEENVAPYTDQEVERDTTIAPREGTTKERLSESPVQVSPQDAQTHNLPPLMGDTWSQDEPSISPVSTSSSPELIEAPHEAGAREETPASIAQSTSTSGPAWSDASLRTYLEDDTSVRDLLVVVHDKSNVKPAGPDHPFVGNLFKAENRRLAEISNRLDGLLGDWLSRKSKLGVR